MYIILINNKLRINIAEIKTEKEVQDLINNRSDLDYLLQIAMSQKNKFLVKELIKKGANVNFYGNLSLRDQESLNVILLELNSFVSIVLVQQVTNQFCESQGSICLHLSL